MVALIDDEEATLKRFRRRGASIALEPANTVLRGAHPAADAGAHPGQAGRAIPALLSLSSSGIEILRPRRRIHGAARIARRRDRRGWRRPPGHPGTLRGRRPRRLQHQRPAVPRARHRAVAGAARSRSITVAAQSGGALRAVTTSSGAPRNPPPAPPRSATARPPGRRRAARRSRSHRSACPRRASDPWASAHRHRRRAIPSARIRRAGSTARAASRLHRAPPTMPAIGRNQHIRPRRLARPAATQSATRAAAAPAQRRAQADRCTTSPAVPISSGTDAEGARCVRPRPAGSRPTSATAIIQSMPSPISHQNRPSRPNGIAISAEQARRHHPDRDDRHGQQIGDHAIGREAMKVIGREQAWWRRRRPATRAAAPRSRGRPTARCGRRAAFRGSADSQGSPRS